MTQDIVEWLKDLVKPGACEADSHVIDAMQDAITEIERLRLAKLPAWAQAALSSSTAKITIVGNTPTPGAAVG